MEKWEYKIFVTNDYKEAEEKLNELGEMGWELVSVSSSFYTLKRQK